MKGQQTIDQDGTTQSFHDENELVLVVGCILFFVGLICFMVAVALLQRKRQSFPLQNFSPYRRSFARSQSPLPKSNRVPRQTFRRESTKTEPFRKHT